MTLGVAKMSGSQFYGNVMEILEKCDIDEYFFNKKNKIK